jgi:hypothetical protein
MRRLFLLSVLLLAGCQGTLGPFAQRKPERVDDPYLPISEQQRRGRDRYALPDDTGTAGPTSGVEYPGVHNR